MEQINKNRKPLARQQLETEWMRYFNTPAPKGAKTQFIVRHITWQKEVEEYGGLNTKVKNQLEKLVQDLRLGKELISPNNLVIKSGTKLLREYKGVKHEVIVDNETYIYQGISYKSLSRIARIITGTQWNGKVFFGVKDAKNT